MKQCRKRKRAARRRKRDEAKRALDAMAGVELKRWNTHFFGDQPFVIHPKAMGILRQMIIDETARRIDAAMVLGELPPPV